MDGALQELLGPEFSCEEEIQWNGITAYPDAICKPGGIPTAIIEEENQDRPWTDGTEETDESEDPEYAILRQEEREAALADVGKRRRVVLGITRCQG